MATYLSKFATLQDFNNAKVQGTLVCPNTALIMADGSVKYTPNLIKSNIGIRGVNGVCYTLTEWNALAPADKPAGVGAYVYDDATGKGFVIHGTISSGVSWSDNTTVVVEGCTTTTSASVALQDFGGKANTDAVLNAVQLGTIVNAPLFTWARGLDFLDPNLEGYVPATGELALIRTNLADINACRALLGQDPIVFDGKTFWSSTQGGADRSWRWILTSWGNYGKTDAHPGIAVALF